MKLKRKPTIIGLSIVAALIIVGGAIALATHHNGQKTATTTPQQDGPGKDTTVHAGPSTDTTSNTTTTQTTTNPDHPVSTTLSTPTGQFLNKHSISLSSNNDASSPVMESTCQSDPGTSCGFEISMTGHTTIVLGPQTVDTSTDGAIYEWNAATKGLTPGSWSVRAFAQKSGATTVYSAPTTLEVTS